MRRANAYNRSERGRTRAPDRATVVGDTKLVSKGLQHAFSSRAIDSWYHSDSQLVLRCCKHLSPMDHLLHLQSLLSLPQQENDNRQQYSDDSWETMVQPRVVGNGILSRPSFQEFPWNMYPETICFKISYQSGNSPKIFLLRVINARNEGVSGKHSGAWRQFVGPLMGAFRHSEEVVIWRRKPSACCSETTTNTPRCRRAALSIRTYSREGSLSLAFLAL